MIPFIITMLILLLTFYYLTIFLHLMGACIFHSDLNVRFGVGLIPFYFWFKRRPKIKEKVKTPTKKKPAAKKKTAVKKRVNKTPTNKENSK